MSRVLYTNRRVVVDTITEDMVIEWNRYQAMFTGIDLTPDQFMEVLLAGPEHEGLISSSLQLGFETGEREMFMSSMSKYLINQEWPCGMDDVDMDDFMKRLVLAAKAKGYKVNDN